MLTRTVDHSVLRTNQGFVIALLGLAFLFNLPMLVGLVAAVLLLGTAIPEAALFKRIYRHVLRPAGLMKPDVRPDNPEPHRFAQGVGGVVTTFSFLALLLGSAVLGWALAWFVIVLASLNLFAGWCAGCTMYYWFNRLGVPGFQYSPVEVSHS